MYEEMNNVEVTTENFEDVEVFKVVEEPKDSENGGIGLAVGICVAVGAGVVAAWHFTKNWREERTIRKLEKKGYKVTKTEEDIKTVNFEVVSEDEESENDK